MNILRYNAATALLVAACPVPSQAQIDPPVTAVIAFSTINLATPHGRAVLNRRIRRAAHASCDNVNERFGPVVRRIQRECRDDLIQTATAAIAARRPAAVATRETPRSL